MGHDRAGEERGTAPDQGGQSEPRPLGHPPPPHDARHQPTANDPRPGGAARLKRHGHEPRPPLPSPTRRPREPRRHGSIPGAARQNVSSASSSSATHESPACAPCAPSSTCRAASGARTPRASAPCCDCSANAASPAMKPTPRSTATRSTFLWRPQRLGSRSTAGAQPTDRVRTDERPGRRARSEAGEDAGRSPKRAWSHPK